MKKALSHITVLDVSRLLAGPYSSMVLADLGANVIKIEVPGRGDDARLFGPFNQGESGYFIALNRNKRGMTLDLRKPEGQAVFKELVAKADIVLENFAAGTMAQWGLDYESLAAINPRLIYASISGFGQTGPYSKLVAFDAIAQAMGGMMSVTGYPDSPPTRVGPGLGDINAGNYATMGILAALLQREKTGQGQKVDISMQDCMIAILENAIVRYTMAGDTPDRIGSRHPSITPYDVFPAKDGYVIIACANEATWRRLAEAMEQPELITDERFTVNAIRTQNIHQLTPIINKWTSSRTRQEILDILRANSVPSAPIFTIPDLVENEHVLARNMVLPVDHPVVGTLRIPGNPIKLDHSPDTIDRPSPLLGQHTVEILKEFSYNENQIQQLQDQKII